MRKDGRMTKTPKYWRLLSLPLLVALIALGIGSSAVAQDGTPMPVNMPPVDLHDGTCADYTPDPTNEIGDLERQAFGDVADDLSDDLGDAPAVGDAEDRNGNGIADADEAGYLTEDTNGNGVLDDGEDTNDNDVLDVGFDTNNDGSLGDDEIIPPGDAAIVAVNFPTIWKAEGEVDQTFDELFETPRVVAVHQSSEQYGTIIACGNVSASNWDDEDQVVIGLAPVGNSGYYGYAVFERDTGNIPVFGENTSGVTVYLFQDLATQRENRQDQATPTS